MRSALPAVSVLMDAGRVTTITPYYPRWAQAARELGGKYDGRDTWRFDVCDLDRVRARLHDVFGHVGEPVDTVVVRMPASQWAREKTLWLFGRNIAQRKSWRAQVCLGPGVTTVSGQFRSVGGLSYRPVLGANTAVLKIDGVPAGHTDLGGAGRKRFEVEPA